MIGHQNADAMEHLHFEYYQGVNASRKHTG
jgi:hypothetical protein